MFLRRSTLIPSHLPPSTTFGCRKHNLNETAAECIALLRNGTKDDFALVKIDCSNLVTSRVICKRRAAKSTGTCEHNRAAPNSSVNSTRASPSPARFDEWPNSSLHVHTLYSPVATTEYRVLLNLSDCRALPGSWYCARHLCASVSGGQLAVAESAEDLRKVIGSLKDVLKEHSTRSSELFNASLLYLDVHTQLYTPNAAAMKAHEWFWGTGAPFTSAAISDCGFDMERSENRALVSPMQQKCKEDRGLCGVLRLKDGCADYLESPLPVQCGASLNAISLCMRVTRSPTRTPAAIHTAHSNPSRETVSGDLLGESGLRNNLPVAEQRTDLSTIGLLFLAVLGLVFAYSVVSLLLVFFVRDSRQRVRDERRRSSRHHDGGNARYMDEREIRQHLVRAERQRNDAESNVSVEFGSYGTGVYEGINGSRGSPRLPVRGGGTGPGAISVPYQIPHEVTGISASAHSYGELGQEQALDRH